MPKLETQINQIFLLNPQSKKVSLVLYEEKLNSSTHIFLLAELRDQQGRVRESDLKNILEIILEVFRANKKLPASSQFETSLSQINQSFATLAHKGRSSWLGKFSSLIVLKNNGNVYLTGNGLVAAYLIRNNVVSEIISAEKRALHPLKLYQNFTTGKLTYGDNLIITTANIFNFISRELFNKALITQSLAEATQTFSKILQASTSGEEGFASFLVRLDKTTAQSAAAVPEIYAPLPEELNSNFQIKKKWKAWIAKLPKNFIGPRNPFRSVFTNLSPGRRFFLISFLIFLTLFGLNLIAFGFRTHYQNSQAKIAQKVDELSQNMNQAESALIYKNDEEAAKFLAAANNNLAQLSKLDRRKAQDLEPGLQNLSNKINHVSIVGHATTLAEFRQPPMMLAKAGNGFLFVNADAKTVSMFDGAKLQDLFLLNSTPTSIRGVIHAPNYASLVATTNQLYRIDENQKLFEPVLSLVSTDLYQLKLVGSNRIYSFDKKGNDIIRINLNNQKLTGPQVVTKDDVLKTMQDFGLDSDLYLLFVDRIEKIVNGKRQVLNLSRLLDPMSAAAKLQVASNLYVLEPPKKRLLIFSKQGKLLNQIYFPNDERLQNFYVDETGRNIYLTDDKKLFEITF